MHIQKKGVSIVLIFVFLCSSFTVAVQTKSDRTTNETSLLDNIRFEECYRTGLDQSRLEYMLQTRAVMNHDGSSSDSNSEGPECPNSGFSDDGARPIDYNVINGDDALMDSCWPMKSQNRRHTGLSPYSTPDNNGAVKWTYEADSWVEGGIAIDSDGVLYFGDQHYYLYAVYPNGTLKWRFKTNGWIWSTPALAADGTIYVGTFGDYLYAINPNGTLKWKFWTGRSASLVSSPVIAKDGTVYFGAMGPNPEPGDERGRIYALFPNGTEKWHYDTDYWITSDPAIADDDTIYIGSCDSYLYALNPNGTLKWRFNTGDIVKSHPAIGEDGTIYFDSFDDYLYALNPDGSLKWKYEDVGSGAAGAAIDVNGIIYIGGSRLSAFYPNGTIKWQYTFGNDKHTGHSSPAISADGTIYIGVTKGEMSGGYIYAIHTNGTLKWQQKISNDWVESSPSIAEDGTVYIGSSSSRPSDNEPSGIVYAFGRNEVNQAPEPPMINGTNRGRVNTSYLFNFTVHDPELDDIELLVDWGDGHITNWLGPCDSDTGISISHTWTTKGTYEVKAKARDTYDGSESDWSTLSVTMPKAKTMRYPFLALFFERFQQLFDRILD